MAKAERKVEERISRREFLKRTSILFLGLGASACGITPPYENKGGSPDLTPTPESTHRPSLSPTETKISTPTQTQTPTPTAEPTPTPINWEAITPEERFNLAPLNYTAENGLALEKSNVSTLRPDLIIYRDENSWARYAFDGESFLKIPEETAFTEIRLVKLDDSFSRIVEAPIFTAMINEGMSEEEIHEARLKAVGQLIDYMIKRGTPVSFRDSLDFYLKFEKKEINERNIDFEDQKYLNILKAGSTSASIIDKDGRRGNVIFFLQAEVSPKTNVQDVYPQSRFLVISFLNGNYWERKKNNKNAEFEFSDREFAILAGVGYDEFRDIVSREFFAHPYKTDLDISSNP